MAPISSAPLRSPASRWVILLVAGAVTFTDAVGYTIVIPALPVFAAELGLGETATGALYASYGLISLLLYLPFGLLVDRAGERGCLAVGMAVLGVASLGFALATDFWSLVTCRLAQGVAASATWAAALPLAVRFASKERRGVEMSVVTTAFSLGVIAGPAFGSLGQVRDPFWAFAVLPFGLAVGAFRLCHAGGSTQEHGFRLCL